MSRRRHGRSRQAGRSATDALPRADVQAPPTHRPNPPQPAADVRQASKAEPAAPPGARPAPQASPTHEPPRPTPQPLGAPFIPQTPVVHGRDMTHASNGVNAGCTAPQLRRFIKSRPYVPMHELRRRFAIDGGDDDVTPVQLEDGRIYVGLPGREGSLLGELLRGGEIGYELSMDPRTPIVIGVYPMRPVPRG
jgi:hypothetical protein